MIEVFCDFCNEKFMKYKSMVGKKNYCTQKCYHEHKKIPIINVCTVCGSEWECDVSGSVKARRKTCSDECFITLRSKTQFKKGVAPVNYKGWRENSSGYIEIYIPDHPNSNKNGYYKRANLVMEKHLGRLLEKGEVVHHVDKNKKNDSIENLMLFKTNAEHIYYHYYVLNDKKINERERKTKFSTEEIKDIKDIYSGNDISINKVANMFGISWHTAREIIHNEREIYNI